MFGGVFPGETDPITPVRASSIRGQLRFWWRATKGAEFTTVKELSEREGEIWGTTKLESQVSISAMLVSEGKLEACASRGTGRFPRPAPGFPGYVIFPFQGNTQDPEIKEARKGVVFDLVATYPEKFGSDVEAALLAFCNFGGLGARTRRGCGALFCEDFAPTDRNDLTRMIDDYRRNRENYACKWPALFSNLYLGIDGNSDAERAWNKVVNLLRDFRQGENVGRNQGREPNRPGRSRWPEPETIRRITNRRDHQHSRIDYIPDNGFPRAEFGLPIIFHFQSRNDPQDCQLLPFFEEARNGEGAGNRMTSPLILRPLQFKNRQIASMILRLVTPPLDSVVFKASDRKDNETLDHGNIVDKRFAAYHNSPLGSPENGGPARSPKGSAIEGFLAYAKENGFQEV
jgi:CRISPR-associated protein Cmr1